MVVSSLLTLIFNQLKIWHYTFENVLLYFVMFPVHSNFEFAQCHYFRRLLFYVCDINSLSFNSFNISVWGGGITFDIGFKTFRTLENSEIGI